jgi:DNA-binding transcriptional MocR family regulator
MRRWSIKYIKIMRKVKLQMQVSVDGFVGSGMERLIDMQLNYPLLASQDVEFAELLRVAISEVGILSALVPTGGRMEDKEIGAEWLSQEGFAVSPMSVHLASGGHHATLAALLACRLANKTIVVEELTYSNFLGMAAMLNIKLLPCPTDALGIKPDAFREVCTKHQAKFGRVPEALYIMATVNNPTGTVLPLDRRQNIAGIARAMDMLIIEDDAYGFLEEKVLPNFFHLAPERSFYVYSFSKPLTRGIKIGYLLAPAAFEVAVKEALRLSATNIPLLYTSLLNIYIGTGRMKKIIGEKQREGHRRQQIARALLSDHPTLGHVNGWHLWLSLPDGLTATALHTRMQERGVLVSPSTSYSVRAPAYDGAIRIALGGEPEMDRVVEGIRLILHEFADGL